MVVVGTLVRCCPADREDLASRLQVLPEITVVPLEAPGDLCVVLAGATLPEVEGKLRDLQELDGVLAAWPVYTHLEDTEPPQHAADARKDQQGAWKEA